MLAEKSLQIASFMLAGRTERRCLEPDYSIRREFVDGHDVRLSRTAHAYRKSLGKGSGRGSALPAQSVNSVIVMS